MRWRMTAALSLPGLVVLVGVLALCCVGCGSTQKQQDGQEEGINQSLYPSCPDLDGLDAAGKKEVVLAWLTTLEKLSDKMPPSVSFIVRDSLNQIQTGEVSPDVTQDIQSTIEAILEGLKQP